MRLVLKMTDPLGVTTTLSDAHVTQPSGVFPPLTDYLNVEVVRAINQRIEQDNRMGSKVLTLTIAVRTGE